MGLLSRLTGQSTAPRKPTDDVLLMHAMMLMASADGALDGVEAEFLETFFDVLPEFQGKDFDDVLTQARKIVARYPNTKASVEALRELSSPTEKQKAYVLAVDIALASGDVDEKEDALLDAMQGVLDIDPRFAQQVIDVLAIKYAR